MYYLGLISGWEMWLDIIVTKLFWLLIYVSITYLWPTYLFTQKRRERGRIDVRGIKLVEPAILHGDGGDASAPNVGEYDLNCSPLWHKSLHRRDIHFKSGTQK